MINDFDNIVSNANIEIHSDRMKNGTLKNIRVLASAFWNGKDIVPVEIGMNIWNEAEVLFETRFDSNNYDFKQFWIIIFT